jgi:hypothetical protein
MVPGGGLRSPRNRILATRGPPARGGNRSARIQTDHRFTEGNERGPPAALLGGPARMSCVVLTNAAKVKTEGTKFFGFDKDEADVFILGSVPSRCQGSKNTHHRFALRPHTYRHQFAASTARPRTGPHIYASVRTEISSATEVRFVAHASVSKPMTCHACSETLTIKSQRAASSDMELLFN